jgi:hypothetical protein
MMKGLILQSKYTMEWSLIVNPTTNKHYRGFQPIGSYHQHNHLAMSMHNMGASHPLGLGAGTPAPRASSFGR